MPRIVYLTGVSIGLVAVAFALTYQLTAPTPGTVEANVRRIRPGMSWDQVDEIMGRESICFPLGNLQSVVWWESPEGFAEVRYGPDGVVESARFEPRRSGDALPGRWRP